MTVLSYFSSVSLRKALLLWFLCFRIESTRKLLAAAAAAVAIIQCYVIFLKVDSKESEIEEGEKLFL
jgi:hypothetical protein